MHWRYSIPRIICSSYTWLKTRFMKKIKCSLWKNLNLSSQIPSFSRHKGLCLNPDNPDIFLNPATAPPVNSSCVAVSLSLRSYSEGIWCVQRLPAEIHDFKGAQKLMSTYQEQSYKMHFIFIHSFAFNSVTKMKVNIWWYCTFYYVL